MSARGGGGCIVVMRWIVVAAVRVKRGLTVIFTVVGSKSFREIKIKIKD